MSDFSKERLKDNKFHDILSELYDCLLNFAFRHLFIPVNYKTKQYESRNMERCYVSVLLPG